MALDDGNIRHISLGKIMIAHTEAIDKPIVIDLHPYYKMPTLRLLKPSSFSIHRAGTKYASTRITTTNLPSQSFTTSKPPLAQNIDRLKGPVTPYPPSTMQSLKNTIAENLSGIIPNTHSLAPSDQQFSLDQVPDLSGKVAVVTGGSEGIGYGCTHTLLSHNISKLFIISLDPSIASSAATAIEQDLGAEKAKRVTWLQCDLSNWPATAQTASDISSQTSRLDILINVAARGIMTYQLSPHSDIDLHMATNHFGHVVLTSHLLPLLKSTAASHGTARIVQFGSNLHEQAPKDTKFASKEELNTDLGPQTQYARSKLATILYAKYLARHLSDKYPGVLSNAVHPGIVETRQSTEHIHEAYPVAGYAMSVGAKPFKKDQFEGAVSAMFAATVTEKSGEYVCPPAIVEEGSGLANDEGLGERLMELTERIVREKTVGESVEKGCPFEMF